jgi:hypothetical protein
MKLLEKLKTQLAGKEKPEHLRWGVLGENAAKKCALDYLRLLKNPKVKIRFDIVEVLLADGKAHEIRHLPNTFTMARPFRYG